MYCVHVCDFLPNDIKPEYMKFFNDLEDAARYVHKYIYDKELNKYRSVCLAGISHHNRTTARSYSIFSPLGDLSPSDLSHTPYRVFDSYGNIVPPNVLVECFQISHRNTYSYIPTGYKCALRKSHANSNALSNAKREAETLHQEDEYFKPSSRDKIAVRRVRQGSTWREEESFNNLCHRSWKKYRRKQYR